MTKHQNSKQIKLSSQTLICPPAGEAGDPVMPEADEPQVQKPKEKQKEFKSFLLVFCFWIPAFHAQGGSASGMTLE